MLARSQPRQESKFLTRCACSWEGRPTAQRPHPLSLGVLQSPVDSPGAELRLLSSGLCLCLKDPPWRNPPGKRQARCCWCWPQWPWSPLQVRAADYRVKLLLSLWWQFFCIAEAISLLKSSHAQSCLTFEVGRKQTNLYHVEGEEKHDPERLSALPCVTQHGVAQPDLHATH